jgi:hypothetical protein
LTDSSNNARPDDLAGADEQVHLRHPEAPGRHEQGTGDDQPACIKPATDQAGDDGSSIRAKIPEGDITSPALRAS